MQVWVNQYCLGRSNGTDLLVTAVGFGRTLVEVKAALVLCLVVTFPNGSKIAGVDRQTTRLKRPSHQKNSKLVKNLQLQAQKSCVG